MQHPVVVLSNESREAYENLFDSYCAEWQPMGISEADVVGGLVYARWRLQRIWCIQAAAHKAGFKSVLPSLHRREKHYARMFRLNLESLLHLRAHRPHRRVVQMTQSS